MQRERNSSANSKPEKWRRCSCRDICSSPEHSKPLRPEQTSAASGLKVQGWDTPSRVPSPVLHQEGPMGFGMGWGGWPHCTDILPAWSPVGKAATALLPYCSQGSSMARKSGFITNKKKGFLCLASAFHLPPSKTILLCKDH